MREHRITFPELALIAGTRGLLGFGAGLLLSDRLKSRRRHTIGWTMLIGGAVSTIPLALWLFRARRDHQPKVEQPRPEESAELITH